MFALQLRREVFQKSKFAKMALHRDIYWVGKQWAVTGYGMQAVDQKQKSKFDIEASRLWEDDLLEVLGDQRWFNPDDFNAGLSVARARYPEPPGKSASRKKPVVKESTAAPVAPQKPAAEAKVAVKPEPRAEPAKADTKPKPANLQLAAEPAKPAPKVDAVKIVPAPAPAKPVLKAEPAKPAPRAEPKKPATAQFNIRIERWPAKFTQMWRVRVKPQ
jgi:hypothetical protein